MTNLQEVRDTINSAVELIVKLEPPHWAGWAVYFLETLQKEAQARRVDPNGVLETVSDHLQTFLQRGKW